MLPNASGRKTTLSRRLQKRQKYLVPCLGVKRLIRSDKLLGPNRQLFASTFWNRIIYAKPDMLWRLETQAFITLSQDKQMNQWNSKVSGDEETLNRFFLGLTPFVFSFSEELKHLVAAVMCPGKWQQQHLSPWEERGGQGWWTVCFGKQ